MRRRSDLRRYTKNSGEDHKMMEDNAISTATETQEVGRAEKVSGEVSDRRARWRICRTSGMYTAAEEMWTSNK